MNLSTGAHKTRNSVRAGCDPEGVKGVASCRAVPPPRARSRGSSSLKNTDLRRREGGCPAHQSALWWGGRVFYFSTQSWSRIAPSLLPPHSPELLAQAYAPQTDKDPRVCPEKPQPGAALSGDPGAVGAGRPGPAPQPLHGKVGGRQSRQRPGRPGASSFGRRCVWGAYRV